MRKLYLFVFSLSLLAACERQTSEAPATAEVTTATLPAGKVPVLNVGTFHMGYTPDANTTEFDENDRENVERVHAIAARIAEFRPTMIVVELVPERQAELEAEYAAYRANPDMAFPHPSEIELLAYEVGRLSGTERIYGIDHKLNYDYAIGQRIANAIDSATLTRYFADPFADHPEYAAYDSDTLSLRDRLRMMNEDPFLDFLITVNADILTYAGTEGNFEGADEAARYYQRNLRMYSNLNRLTLTPADRILMVSGASHAAFFRDFLRRSPKYASVPTLDYL